MSVPELYKVTDIKTPVAIQKAFEYLHKQTTPVQFTTVAPTADKVPQGTIIVHDDGTHQRLYFRTGKGKVGYIAFTATI